MRRLQAPLLGGLFIGILSALPFVNYCCCLWVLVGGVLTTYLKQQGRERLEPVDVALAGLFAGLIGAVISLVLSALMFALSGDVFEQQMRTIVEQYPQLPPDVRDRLLTLSSGVGLILIVALVTVPVYAVFGMVGAMLGLLFFKPLPPPAEA